MRATICLQARRSVRYRTIRLQIRFRELLLPDGLRNQAAN